MAMIVTDQASGRVSFANIVAMLVGAKFLYIVVHRITFAIRGYDLNLRGCWQVNFLRQWGVGFLQGGHVERRKSDGKVVMRW